MDRFIIGHNVDPSNWRQRLETLTPRCLEMFVPPRYCTQAGLAELEHAFEGIAAHPAAGSLEFFSCHFPWGETVDGFSQYRLVDNQYFHSFIRIAAAFDRACRSLNLPPERSALNFHNLYEFPRLLLEKLKRENGLTGLRDIFLSHAFAQTAAAKDLLELFGLELTLVNENNPPIGAGEHMSIVDVFPNDLASRSSALGIGACFDLSHFFMTKFYYDLKPRERPGFPYLDLEAEANPAGISHLESFLDSVKPLYFHVSDTRAPGTGRSHEGVPVGTGDTPWIDVLAALGQYAFHRQRKLYLIVEIKGAYTAEGIRQCRESEQALRGYIEDCFSSGFLKALEEKDTAL